MGERPHWQYLGSSDGPPILGVPSYGRTAINVWEEKLRLAPEGEPSAMMRWGVLLEPLILRQYAAQTGRTIDRKRRQRFLEGFDFIGCRIDAEDEDGLVEAKFAPESRGYGEPADGPQGLPLYVRTQVQHQLMVTGRELAHVPVLIRGYDLRTFEVPADPAFQADYRDELVEWWNAYVVTKTPPPVDDSEAYADHLARRHPQDDGSSMVAPASLHPVFRQLAQARGDLSAAEGRKRGAENFIKAAMGEAVYLLGDDVAIRYATSKHTTVAWELIAKAYRRLLDDLRGSNEALAAEATDAILSTDLDAVVSLYTTTELRRGPFLPRFSGALAELAKRPQDQEETDASAEA